MSTETKLTRSDAGRKGGNATLQRYGRQHFVECGKCGGRSRNPTYEDIMAARLLGQKNNKEVASPPGDLGHRQLLKRFKLHRRSSGITETVQAGTAQETPHEQVPARKESGIEVTPP